VKNLLAIFAVLVLSWWAIRNLFVTGYFSMHDDLQAMRQLQMHKCFEQDQLPCRWVPDMGFEYGYPLFNYYPPMPYYLGEIFVLAGWQIIDSVKVGALLAFLLGAIGMYLLASEFWGRLGGIASAIFLTYAPYHAVDLYVRGAVNEFWAITWFPWIYWTAYKLILTEKWKYVMWLSFFVGMLMLSHNPLLMIFTPTLILWCGFWLLFCWLKGDNVRMQLKIRIVTPLLRLSIAAFWAFTLAAFFTLPVLFEKQFAHVDSIVMGYFNYLAHFVALQQFFLWKDWGYGASGYGLNDDMSFQIGHIHWIGSLLSLVVAWKLWKKKQELSWMILLMLGITYGSAFMGHLRSNPIWAWIKPLEFLQFPWRWLSLVIFGVSFLSGSLVFLKYQISNIKYQKYVELLIFTFLIIGVILYNHKYFTWDIYYPQMTDEEKFSGENWKRQLTSSIFDYLPISAPLPPVGPPAGDLVIVAGAGEYVTLEKAADSQIYELALKEESVVRLNTFYFPNWRYWLSNGESVELTDYKLHEELGVPEFKIPAGEYTLSTKLEDTLVRKIGNWVSMIGWGAFLIFVLKWSRGEITNMITRKN
jgi:hypothetical protein